MFRVCCPPACREVVRGLSQDCSSGSSAGAHGCPVGWGRARHRAPRGAALQHHGQGPGPPCLPRRPPGFQLKCQPSQPAAELPCFPASSPDLAFLPGTGPLCLLPSRFPGFPASHPGLQPPVFSACSWAFLLPNQL